MISIVIPIYNAGLYLPDCLNSIRQQSYNDFEVLCVNDGSTDNSAEICQSISSIDNRFKLIDQINGGVSSARNSGIKYSSGEYICFIDSDDVIHKDYLKNHILNIQSADASICGHTSSIRNLGSNLDYSVNSYHPHELINLIISECVDHPNLWEFLFKTSIIKKNDLSFVVGCIRNEDDEFYLKYLANSSQQINISTYNGYFYRIHSHSAMYNLTLSSLTSLDAAMRYEEYLLQREIIDKNNMILSKGIWKFVLLSAVRRNKNIYNYIHSNYDVVIAMNEMCEYPIFKKRCFALLYCLVGKSYFYGILSFLSPILKRYIK